MRIAVGTGETDKRVKFQKVYHSFDMVNPFILKVYNEKGPYNPPGDMHFSPQILLVLSGAMEMHFNNFKVLLHSGEFCLTGPWEPHRAILLPGECRYLVITLDLALIGAISTFHDVDWIYLFLIPPEEHPRFSSRKERAIILRAARYLLWIQKQNYSGYRSYQWLEIHRLLWHIQSRIPNQNSSAALQKIYPAIILARNEVSRLIRLDEAAQVCGLSRSRFSDLFKQETGMVFSEFSLRIRINASAIALTNSRHGKSIKQIAADFGFSDVSHYYRSFRRILGCTPLDFADKQEDFILPDSKL